MALERGELSNVVRVAAGATVGIATCTSGKKVYIKSIIAHASGVGVNTATGQVYFTQAGVTTGVTTKIFDIDVIFWRDGSYRTIISTCISRKRRYTRCWNRKCGRISSNTRQLYDHRR